MTDKVVDSYCESDCDFERESHCYSGCYSEYKSDCDFEPLTQITTLNMILL